MTNAALRKAIEAVGDGVKLAKALEVTPQAVNQWHATGIPAKRVIPIEQATGGKVSRHELRPDLYPIETVAAGTDASAEPAAEAKA